MVSQIDRQKYELTFVWFYDLGVQRKSGDPAKRFGLALAEAMAALEMTNVELAARLEAEYPGTDQKMISDYRTGRRRLVPDRFIYRIAKEVGLQREGSPVALVNHFGYDPLMVLDLCGSLPPDEDEEEILSRLETWGNPPTDMDVVDRLLDIERLDLEIQEREVELAEVERDRGAASVVRAVTESHTYAAAVWPVLAYHATTDAAPIHVSDRVDIRRLDGSPVKDKQVWDDLNPALSRARALPTVELPHWSGTGPDALNFPDPHTSMWNIRRLDAPRRPQIQQSHPGFAAVALSATVNNSWVGYVASMVAYALGYGLTSSTDLGRHLHDYRPAFVPDTHMRNGAHEELLRRPGDRRVWFHIASIDLENPARLWTSSASENILHVRLVESDALLSDTAEERLRQPGFHDDPADVVVRWRKSRDTAMECMPRSEWNLPLDVKNTEWDSPEKWDVSLALAVRVLEQLQGLGLKPWRGLQHAHTEVSVRDPYVAGPTLQWLRGKKAPFCH